MSRTWKDAHDDVDSEVSRIQGLAEVLHEVTMEFPGLANPNPMAHGILTLIRTIKEGIERLDQFHREEWKLQYQAAERPVASD